MSAVRHMMQSPWRTLFRSTLIVPSVLAFTLGLPAPAAAPSARTMVFRSIKAHQKLGPCIIKTQIVVQPFGETKRVYQSTIQWNDATHYVLHQQNGADRGSYYVNGGSQVVTDDRVRNWIRLNPGNNDHVTVREVIRQLLPDFIPGELMKLTQDPVISREMAKVHLSPAVVNGEKAYRLYLPLGPMVEGGTAYTALAFGRIDSLIRKFAVRGPMGDEIRFTAQYQMRKTRFPVSTFAFKPPAGYTEADMVEDVVQIEE